MIDRNVEESLNLVSVEVAGHDSVHSGCAEEIGAKLGSDRYSRLVLPVLTCPSEVRHNCDDLVCGSSLGCVNGKKQFHEVLGRRESGLEDEDGRSAYAFGK